MAKKSKMANADIRKSHYGDDIYMENKTLAMPPDLAEALKYKPKAL